MKTHIPKVIGFKQNINVINILKVKKDNIKNIYKKGGLS